MPTTTHHFENFIGHYVRVIKTDRFARYGILTDIKKGYLYLRYADGKQEALHESLVASIGNAPEPRHSIEDGNMEHEHQGPTTNQQPAAEPQQAKMPVRFTIIVFAFFLVLGGMATIIYSTGLMPMAVTLASVLGLAIVAASGLALTAVGLYLIIKA